MSTTRHTTFAILALAGLISFSGCSPKPSSEEIAAQVKAAMEAEKTKEQAVQAAMPTAPGPAAKAKPRAHSKPAQSEPPTQVEQPAPAHKIACANCGVVISVQAIEQEGKGSGLGVIAGGVTGGLVGNQIGQGSGRDIATVIGVVGGAIAGNKIEKTIKKTQVYDVTVRMNNSEDRIVHYETDPGFAIGDKVKIENNQVVRQ